MSGVIPGLQDLFTASFLGIGNTSYTQLGIPWNCAAKLLDLPPGIIPGLKDHLPESSLEFLSSFDALPGETRPLGFLTSRDFSERPYLYHPVPKVFKRTLLKDRNRRIFAVFLSENSLFPSV